MIALHSDSDDMKNPVKIEIFAGFFNILERQYSRSEEISRLHKPHSSEILRRVEIRLCRTDRAP